LERRPWEEEIDPIAGVAVRDGDKWAVEQAPGRHALIPLIRREK
jgi:hypothetical protein